MCKRCHFYFLTFVISLSFVFNTYGSVEWVEVLWPETIIDVLNDVPALYTNEDNPDDDPVYSCAAFIKNYYQQIFGVSVYNLVNNGPPLLHGSSDSFVRVNAPHVGDIVFYPLSSNRNNHSAIVKEVSGNVITLIEQNWKSGNRAGRYRTITYPASNFSIWRLKSQTNTSEEFTDYDETELLNELSETDDNTVDPILDEFNQEAVEVFNQTPLPEDDDDEILNQPPETETPITAPAIKTFTDLSENHWAYDYINNCVARGIFNGYSNGTFRPDNIITRGEFAKLIYSALNLTGDKPGALTFSDVNKNDWYYSYIEHAQDYLTGYSQDNKQYYKPNDPALREDICVAIVKMINAEDILPIDNLDFSDKGSIKKEAERYIQIAVYLGIIQGFNDGSVRPKEPITRAQAAVLLSKALNI